MFLKAYSLSTQKVHGGTYKPPKPVFSFWDSNPIPMWQVTVTSRLSDEESRTVRTGAGSGCAGVTTGEDTLPQSSWGGHSSPRTPPISSAVSWAYCADNSAVGTSHGGLTMVILRPSIGCPGLGT